ncbi:MAG: glycine cleavage system aminomethyltransferase GcvT [Deltaproteobacteria bacterium]|nr:MAG: glycine cleavage system aminomethyltransferase GcvT [Deltaproteobacteria bacterium]
MTDVSDCCGASSFSCTRCGVAPGRERGYVPAAVTEELKNTPLVEEHRALGARLVPFAGYHMPVQYAGVKKEHQAVRERAGIFDVSHMGELVLSGEHALAVVDYQVTNRVSSLDVGQAVYTVCLNDEGTILDDLIIYRLADEEVMVVCNASNHGKIAKHFAAAAEEHCEFDDRTETTALLALQGPRALAILKDAGADASLLDLGFFRLGQGQVGGVQAIVARTGYTGEDGVEIFCAATDAVTLFRALVAAGEAHGLAPTGLGARDTLRLEARLSLYGNEIDETTNPYEAGLGWTVKLKKGDFRGRDALVAIKEAGVSRKLVGFEMTARGIGRHGYPILDAAGTKVGEVTSGSPAPTLGKNIGLGYVPLEMSAIGTDIGIEIRGKTVTAVVVKTPFYKRSES